MEYKPKQDGTPNRDRLLNDILKEYGDQPAAKQLPHSQMQHGLLVRQLPEPIPQRVVPQQCPSNPVPIRRQEIL